MSRKVCSQTSTKRSTTWNGTGSSSSSTAPAASTMDTSVDDSCKRAASAGESDERASKKQKVR